MNTTTYTQYTVTDTNTGATLTGDKYEIDDQFAGFYGIDADTPAEVTEMADRFTEGLGRTAYEVDSDAAAYLMVTVEQA